MRSEKSGPNGSERSERSERSQRERSEKSESPYRTRTSDRELGPDRPSDLLIATFGGTLWVKTPKGERGKRPGWLDDPSHTAADMGAGPAVNPVAFAKPAPRKIRQGARA